MANKAFREIEQNWRFCFQSSIAFKVMHKLPGYDIKRTSSEEISKHKTTSLFPVQGGKSIFKSSLYSPKRGELHVVQ